jgi:hypothetical protein
MDEFECDSRVCFFESRYCWLCTLLYSRIQLEFQLLRYVYNLLVCQTSKAITTRVSMNVCSTKYVFVSRWRCILTDTEFQQIPKMMLFALHSSNIARRKMGLLDCRWKNGPHRVGVRSSNKVSSIKFVDVSLTEVTKTTQAVWNQKVTEHREHTWGCQHHSQVHNWP